MPSVMSFPTRIVFGRGAIRELPSYFFSMEMPPFIRSKETFA